jgi:hypothetical protein
MPVIDAIDQKKYGRLLAKYLPGVIRSDEEHDRLAGLLMKLALAEQKTAEERRLIELLERLVDDYDEQRMQGRLAALEPLSLLQHLFAASDGRGRAETGRSDRLLRLPVCGVRSDGRKAPDQL